MKGETFAVALVMTVVLVGANAQGRAAELSRQRLHPGGASHAAARAAGMTSAYPDAAPRFHNGAELQCSDCHISHASQSHLRDPLAPGLNETIPFAGGPNLSLLRANDPLDLCLSCHDGKPGAPDVVEADANGLAQRSGGFFAAPGVKSIHGHDLGRGLPPAPDDYCTRCHFSSGDQAQVTCIDCHNPHGNGVARNLQWASFPEGTPELGLLVNPGANGMDRYEQANVAYGTLNSGLLREVTNICIDCHHVFTGQYYIDPDANGIHNRHPAYESERNSTNSIQQGEVKGTTVPAHWEGGTGTGFTGTTRVRPVVSLATDFASAQIVDAQTNGVFCLSCHRAHGSDQAFGLVWPLSNGVSPTGCDQCHMKADVSGPSPAEGPQAQAR